MTGPRPYDSADVARELEAADRLLDAPLRGGDPGARRWSYSVRLARAGVVALAAIAVGLEQIADQLERGLGADRERRL